MVNLLPPPEPATNSPSSSNASNAVVPATQTSAPQVDPQQELEWQKSLKNLESQIGTYKERRAKQGAVADGEVEQVAQAMEQVAKSHTDPKVKVHWLKKAAAFRAAGSDDRDGILEDIGKGFLVLLTTPFFLVGAVLQAAGGILSGVGSILKGLGGLARKLTYTGQSKRESSDE